ncbi:dihydrolipoamide acetyltransferase family protein [Georgenia sp. Z1344]|uniref:dihydrolipoamide acetyltransferase family protein n=1 Tax=Georgenia sp. Z1344 TaxID=3416706 RepID=UPI003CF77083
MSDQRHQTFRLPDVGEGLTDAEIVSWEVAVGQRVEVNQTLCEIETEKSVVELPSPFAGEIRALLVEEGTTVEVGAPIVELDTRPDEPAAPEPAAGTAEGDEADDDAGGSGAVLVGYGTRPGAARRRPRREPAAAQQGGSAAGAARPSAAASASPAPAPLVSRPSPAGTRVAPGRPRTAPGGEAPGAAGPGVPGRATREGGGSSTRFVPASGGPTRAKPPVRRLAKDLGVDIDSVHGTGPGGIVTREDVVALHQRSDVQQLATWSDEEPWLEGGSVSPDGRRTRVPARSVRRRTAEAMVQSAFTAPHVSEFHTIDVTRTMELVARLKADREFEGLHVTPLLIAMRALLLAVNRHPEINASWDDDTQEIVYKHYVNLGIAAATPRGLVVPNVKDAHRLNLKELAQALGELTSTARAGRTQPADMADGTITITNVGAFGIDTGTPILNPGEAAILALGAVRQQPWVHDGEIAVRWVTQLALSFDHRLVDGALGSFVLKDIATILEDPSMALVWA